MDGRMDGPRPAEFPYGDAETSYISSRDPLLAGIVSSVGHLREPMDPDLFTSLVRNIIGQQISIPRYEAIWSAFRRMFGDAPDPSEVIAADASELRGLGITSMKTGYIRGIAGGFLDGSIDEDRISDMDDDAAMEALTSIRGVGPWTAEMAMIFRLGRENVFSYGDLALIRGIRMLYGVPEVDRGFFDELRRRFSPCCTVASFYIWEVGEGRIPGLRDPRRTSPITTATSFHDACRRASSGSCPRAGTAICAASPGERISPERCSRSPTG